MISSAAKSDILGRLDKVIQASKKARQRANNIEANKLSFAKGLFDYING